MVSSTLLLATTGISQAEEQKEYSFDQMVVTANRVPTKVSEVAANVTVINKEQIEKGHYWNLGDVLQNVNGVMVTTQGHPGAGNYVRLNGDDRVLIMIDGRRMNMDKGAANGRAGYDLNSLPTLANIERIEIVKGAASSLYGTDAVGGVVNIITRQGSGNHTQIDIASGSWGTRNYSLVNEGKEKDVSWYFTVGKQRQDHFAYKDSQTNDVKNMENSDYDKNNMTLRIDKEIGVRKSITLNFEHMDDKSGQPYMVPGRVVWGSSMHFPNDFKTSLTNNWGLTYNFSQGLETAGYLRVYENYYTSDSHQLRGGTWSTSSYHNKATGAEWQNAWRLDHRNLLVGGTEWRDTKVTNLSKYDNRTVNSKAVYLEDRMSIGDKWTFTPGVRYDHHNMFGGQTTPKAALNYAMNDKTNMYVSWGKVFNAPNVDDLFWPDNGFTAGNPNLKPEKGENSTVGINYKMNHNTELKANYFNTQLNDAIAWAPDAAGKWMPSNVDQQRKHGFELAMNTQLSPKFNTEIAYTYLNVENKGRTDSDYKWDERNSAPNGYKIAVNYSQDAWDINLTGNGATGRSLSNFTSSHYWVWNTTINYKFDKNIRGYFKVNNITNQAYEITGNTSSNGGVGAFPMPSRNFQFGVQYQL